MLDKRLPGGGIEAPVRVFEQRSERCLSLLDRTVLDGRRALLLCCQALLVTGQLQGGFIGLAQGLKTLRVGFRVVVRQACAVGAANQVGVVGRLDAQANPAAHDQASSSSVSGRSGRFNGRSHGRLASSSLAPLRRLLRMQRFQCSPPWRASSWASSSSLLSEQFHSALP
ncbi:hypothetical protein D3C72_1449590 [compost metagenome]